MITVIFQHNPLDKSEDITVQLPSGQTINELLQHLFTPNFKDFTSPTICQLNGAYVLRANWPHTQLKDGDTLTFSSLVQDPVTAFAIVVAVIAVGAAVYAYANMPKPTESNIPGAAPTYSLAGHRNQNKLGQPIEVCYGRNYIYGAFAAKSYNVYRSNDQYLFSLICLGQGEFDVHGVYIEDTPISSFQNTNYEVYRPGQKVTLFPDNVSSSVEVSEIEMPGTNEAGGNIDLGPYVANPPNTVVNRIEIDYAMPKGLYEANDDGGLDSRTISAQFEYQEIDNNGASVGNWKNLVTISRTMKTTTPQRFTEGADVPEGRYQVRGKRTNLAGTNHKIGDTLVWQTLRVFMPDVRDYGDVTLLAVKAKATNNLNSQSQTSIKVDATRKLPIYNQVSKTWSSPQATRSAVWALCDLFRSRYGANLSDRYLALEQLADIDNELIVRGDNFDWIFDKRMTIWEAAKKICRAVRGVPRLPGSRVTIVRDKPQTIPKGVFTMDNIVSGSFSWDSQFFEVNEKDALRVEYADLATGQIETVLCQLPNGTANNIEEMRLEGVKNRAQAYREGMYILASKYYLREGVSFGTGLEGHIPNYGDIISVSYDIPYWGVSGFVEEVTPAGSSYFNIKVDTELDFSQVGNHYITFRKPDGSAAGPYLCTKVDDETVRVGSTLPPITVRPNVEPPFFQFGLGDNWSKICRVTDITPSTGERVTIKAVVYKSIIHSFDGLPTPDYGDTGSGIVIPPLPVVTGLRVNAIPNEVNRVQASWTPALGAQYYVIESSSDGVTWVSMGTTTTTVTQMEVMYETLWLRVAGVNQGQGPWVEWSGSVGSANEIPTDVKNLKLVNPFVGKQFTVTWDQILNANYYEIKITDLNTNYVLRTINNTSLSYVYTSDDAHSDGGVSRDFEISVTAVNNIGRSLNAATLDVSNPVPPKVTGVVATKKEVNSQYATYDLDWTKSTDPDTVGYKIWQSVHPTFTPDPERPTWTVPINYMEIQVPMFPGGDPNNPTFHSNDTYYKLGAYDPWTNELIYSDLLFIPGESINA